MWPRERSAHSVEYGYSVLYTVAVTMTLCADGRTRRTSARRSAERSRYAIDPAYPREIHSGKNLSSGRSDAGAMPHASKPSARAWSLIEAEVSDGILIRQSSQRPQSAQ